MRYRLVLYQNLAHIRRQKDDSTPPLAGAPRGSIPAGRLPYKAGEAYVRIPGWLHIEHLTAWRIHHLHLLSQVVLEVIVGLVAPSLLSAAEYIDVITALFAGLPNGDSTQLFCLSFWFKEAYSSIGHLFLLFY